MPPAPPPAYVIEEPLIELEMPLPPLPPPFIGVDVSIPIEPAPPPPQVA